MKKLYRKGTVHPSPPTISDQLSFLPAAILTLTAALSPQDKEVLAYLISCSSTTAAPFSRFSPRRSPASGGADHAPVFNCSCFRCYMSYWVRWDSSPNRQLIHEIIDAFEEWLAQKGGRKTKNNKNSNNNGARKEKRNKRGASTNKNQQPAESTRNDSVVLSPESIESTESASVVVVESGSTVEEVGDRVEEDQEKGSVRRFMSFIGERIWGGWGQ